MGSVTNHKIKINLISMKKALIFLIGVMLVVTGCALILSNYYCRASDNSFVNASSKTITVYRTVGSNNYDSGTSSLGGNVSWEVYYQAEYDSEPTFVSSASLSGNNVSGSFTIYDDEDYYADLVAQSYPDYSFSGWYKDGNLFSINASITLYYSYSSSRIVARFDPDNVVTVYRLIMKDTIEERIIQLQNRKKELADQLLDGDSLAGNSFTREELLELLS